VKLAATLAVDTPIATLVLDHPECAAVLDRYRLDYNDERALGVACRERRVAPAKLLDDCALAVQRREPDVTDPATLSTHALITKVIGRHHRYLHRTLPFLQKLAHEVSRPHGEPHAELRVVTRLVDALATGLLAHLDDEERTLFPALLSPDAVEIAPLLVQMQRDHADVADMLSVLRTTTNDYACPPGVAGGCRILMRELAYLDADTRAHFALEDDVLRPRFLRNDDGPG